MDRASLKAEAKKRLSGKWGKVILTMIVTGLVVGLIGSIPGLVVGLIGSIPGFTKTTTVVNGYYFNYTVTKDNIISVLLSLVATVVSVVFSYGLIAALLKAYRGEDIGAADGVKIAVKEWKRALLVFVSMIKKLLIPTIMIVVGDVLGVLVGNGVVTAICAILLIVGGIWFFVAGLHYALAYFIAADQPNLSEEEAVNKSKELMTNKRGKLVVLYLSFILWYLLVGITFGIAMLWVAPYMQFTMIAFYEFCKGGSTNTTETKSE